MTVHPIFTPKDVVYDAGLLGTWKTKGKDRGDHSTVITNLSTDNSIELPGQLSALKHKGYLIARYDVDNNLLGEHIGFLARIGGRLYFDYYPVDRQAAKKLDDFFLAHFVKLHTSYRVEIFKDGHFELSQLDASYVSNLIEQKKIRIKHERKGDKDIVITASTEELQQYLIKYSDEPSAYMEDKLVFNK